LKRFGNSCRSLQPKQGGLSPWRDRHDLDAAGRAALALYRLIASEAHQFPELALAYRESGVRSRGLIAGIFSNAMRDDQLKPADVDFVAEQFLYTVIEGPARALVLEGQTATSEKALRERVTAAVNLFLNGCRDHPAQPASSVG
jgi:TetR/AcrR family transcriptional repressor of mexJK operon